MVAAPLDGFTAATSDNDVSDINDSAIDASATDVSATEVAYRTVSDLPVDPQPGTWTRTSAQHSPDRRSTRDDIRWRAPERTLLPPDGDAPAWRSSG